VSNLIKQTNSNIASAHNFYPRLTASIFSLQLYRDRRTSATSVIRKWKTVRQKRWRTHFTGSVVSS